MANHPRPLNEGFETEYANQLIGADTLWGGDIGKPEGAAHFIADSYPKAEVELPQVYLDERAVALRASDGANPDNVNIVQKYARDYGLLEAEGRLVEALGPNADPLRLRYARNMGRAFEIMTRTALASAKKEPLPPFEDRYRAVAMHDPEIIDTTEIRTRLSEALAAAGVELSAKRGLREAVNQWEAKIGNVPPEQFAAEVARVNERLMAWTRSNIFRGINFGYSGHDAHLDDVAFDGLTLKTLSGVSYSGSSAYAGGTNSDGTPALRDLIEYNTDHPVTRAGLWHLASHEMKPGHYIDGAVADLGWRAGRLGFEAAAHTMCTSEVVLREGWAQNALAMALGGDEQAIIDELGRDHVIQLMLERLQDAGKNNATILFQGRGVSIEDVRKHLEVECVLSDAYVKKLSGVWAQHVIFGPMYGPAYATGYDIVRRRIERHGSQKVAAAALHQHGYCDIDTFQQSLESA